MSDLPLIHPPPAVADVGAERAGWSRVAALLLSSVTIVAFAFAIPLRWFELLDPSPQTLAEITSVGLRPDVVAAWVLAFEVATAVAFIWVGLALLRQPSARRPALMAGTFLVVFGVSNGSLTPTIHALLGFSPAVDSVVRTLETLSWLGIALFFYLFPDGRFVPGATRWLAVAWIPVCVLWNFDPGSPLAPTSLSGAAFVALVGGFWVSWVMSQVYRYQRVSGLVEQRQTRRVVAALALIVVTVGITAAVGVLVPGYDPLATEQPTSEALLYQLAQAPLNLVVAALPIAVGVSIQREGLWDLDALVGRTLVYASLTGFVVLTYVVIVGGFGWLLQSSASPPIALFATGIVAVAFHPVRLRVQGAVDRMLYGDRRDPYAVLSRVGRRAATPDDADTVLPAVAETIAASLRLPYAAIFLQTPSGLRAAGVAGSPVGPIAIVPITYQGEVLGELRSGSRGLDEQLSRAEVVLLGDIATHMGAVVRTASLTVDLRHSREQIVTGREEERRRLRRDLHDGLGPKLAGQTMKLEAALDSLKDDPIGARALISEAIDDSVVVLAEIRRLVYGLRPPALDQLGLLGAIRDAAAQSQLASPRDAPLDVHVDPTGDLEGLPAAVEVACYRIVVEALANVARHAQARHAWVGLRGGSALKAEIVDDGKGLPTALREGVGLRSMRERAEEIGGWCSVESPAVGGTRVIAHLPIAERNAAEP